jgi:hypothetical protein
MVDSPEVTAAKRLLDCAKDNGFVFQRLAPGDDGPVRGVRQTPEWLDEIYLGGFWREGSCHAIRRRRWSVVVPGGLPVAQQISGDAIEVLHTVVCDWLA